MSRTRAKTRSELALRSHHKTVLHSLSVVERALRVRCWESNLPHDVASCQIAGIFHFHNTVLCFALLCFALRCFALLTFALLSFALLCLPLLCLAFLSLALLSFALLSFSWGENLREAYHSNLFRTCTK